MDWLGYARTGKEFDVMDDLADIGIAHWRGERIEFERRGKVRTAEPYIYPALPNYIWIMPEPFQVHRLSEVRHLANTFHFLSRDSVRSMAAFRARAEAAKEKANGIIGNRKAICQYQKGDRVEILSGPFLGELATFSRMVQRSSDLFPRLKVELSVMGGVVPIEIDPLSVRKAV